MYTEEEAKVKWCFQSIAGGSYWKKCVASGCMAWRWDEERSGVLKDGTYRKVGYCGIAGKP